MPTPREILEEKLRRLEEEKAELERDMQELERIVSKYGLLVVATPSSLPPPIKINRAALSQAAREAESIIRAAGHPIPINDLFTKLVLERGVELTGDAAANNLAAAMVTSGKLQYIKEVGWWIKGIPWPTTPEDIARLHDAPLNEPPVDNASHLSKGIGPRRTEEKKRLFEAIRDLLKGRAEPMKFGELFDRIKEMGVPIGGNNERQNLSVFIAKFSCFQTDGRREGWRYIPERDFEEKDSVGWKSRFGR